MGVAGLTALLAFYATGMSSHATAPSGYAATQLIAAKSRFIKSTVARGLIEPKVGAEVKVGSQISGIVKRMLVGVGERVTRGEVLAELDDAPQLAQIATIGAQLNEDKIQWDYARKELDRLIRLASRPGGRLVSEQAVDEQRQKMNVNEAEYQRVSAELKEAQITLGYTQIRAPIDGTIASISTYRGETVAASFAAPTFVVIVDLNNLEIRAYVDEADIGSVHVGQGVDFRIESFPDRVLHGVVRAINPKPEVVNNVVNYVVLVDFTAPRAIVVRPEMTVHVDFILDVREDAVVVSNRALLREDSTDFVVIRRGDRWSKVPVTTGLRDSGKIEILSGLTAGEPYLADKNDWKRIAPSE